MLLTKIDPDTIVGIVFGIVGAAGAIPGVVTIVQHVRNCRARSRSKYFVKDNVVPLSIFSDSANYTNTQNSTISFSSSTTTTKGLCTEAWQVDQMDGI